MDCHDCGCVEGAIHTFGCDCERCPFCGGQLIMCGCDELEANQIRTWLEILTEKGRIPYIEYPVLCAKCGVLYPDFFEVADKEWTQHIQPDMRDTVICKGCYEEIKKKINRAKT